MQEFLTRNAGLVLVLFLVVPLLRWMMTRFEREIQDIRSSNERLVEKIVDSLSRSNSKMVRSITAQSMIITSMQKQLLSHDLTVTGINPSVGEELNERADKAVRKYEELQIILNECQSALRDMLEED